MNSEVLIDELLAVTQSNLKEAQGFQNLSDRQLKWKPSDDRWNILECIEHLNRYGEFYIPEIQRQIQSSRFAKSSQFKSGFLGNYFVKMILPNEKSKKMKTFPSMNPIDSDLDRRVLDTFIEQQESLMELLAKARDTDLTKVKTSISISKWLRLRLGDTLRVVIYHNLRHILQAKNLVQNLA